MFFFYIIEHLFAFVKGFAIKKQSPFSDKAALFSFLLINIVVGEELFPNLAAAVGIGDG